MLADGDMIGDHTWSHPDVADVAGRSPRVEIVADRGAIRKATGGFTPACSGRRTGTVSPALDR